MRFQQADHLLIPLLDGSACVAQVGAVRGQTLLLLLTQRRATSGDATLPIPASDVTALLPVDASSLPDGHWPVLGYDMLPPGLPLPQLPDGADGDLHDPAIVEALANACEGLYAWDGFPDPDFFAKLLRVPDQRPPLARFAAQMPDTG